MNQSVGSDREFNRIYRAHVFNAKRSIFFLLPSRLNAIVKTLCSRTAAVVEDCVDQKNLVGHSVGTNSKQKISV